MRPHLILIVIIAFVPLVHFAQIDSLKMSAYSYSKQQIGVANVTLEYYRPSGNGEKIFGGKIPWYEYWFTGDYTSTTITFSEDVLIDEQLLPKGSYSIFSKPDPGFWEIVFYTDLNLKSLPKPLDESKIVLQVALDMEEYYYGQETFRISFENITPNGASLFFVWEDFYAELPFEFPATLKQVDALVKKNSVKVSFHTLYEAARYLYYFEDDAEKALYLLNRAIEQNSESAKALYEIAIIQQSEGEEDSALKNAKKALKLASKTHENDWVIKINALLKDLEE